MHKIAIITSTQDWYDDYSPRVVTSITDWTEVTGEQLKALKAVQYELDFVVLERKTGEAAFIAKTVADYIAWSEKEAERKAAAKAKREENKKKKELLKNAKTEEAEKKLLEELQQKYSQ